MLKAINSINKTRMLQGLDVILLATATANIKLKPLDCKLLLMVYNLYLMSALIVVDVRQAVNYLVLDISLPATILFIRRCFQS